jgi:putative (di)nucleoside polyphosphate hydrolase
MVSNRYCRTGVGVLVVNHDGLVLALDRVDVINAWQLPQGGIDVDEEPVDAARRELAEETGIVWRDLVLLDTFPCLLGYDLPDAYRSERTGRGQVHHWYIARFEGSDDDIELESTGPPQEFASWRWVRMADLLTSTWEIRRPVYELLASRWEKYLT